MPQVIKSTILGWNLQASIQLLIPHVIRKLSFCPKCYLVALNINAIIGTGSPSRGQMRRIYQNAHVIIWLGASTMEINYLFYWMRRLDQQMHTVVHLR